MNKTRQVINTRDIIIIFCDVVAGADTIFFETVKREFINMERAMHRLMFVTKFVPISR